MIEKSGEGEACTMAAKPNYLNQSVVRTMQILEYLALNREAGLSEIGNHIEESKMTTHRFLTTMKYAGFIGHNPMTRKYYLAHKIFEMGQNVESSLELRSLARPLLEELHEYTYGTIVFGILENNTEVIFVDSMQNKHGLRFDPAFGLRSRAHATSTGKALFAFSHPGNFEAYVEKYGLRRITPNTVVDKKQLLEEFSAIRQNGFSVDDEGSIIWVKGVAAPVFGIDGDLVAAVSTTIPKIQDQLDRFDDYTKATVETAGKITQALYGSSFQMVRDAGFSRL